MGDHLSPGPFPSWDDFRFFLATSETGSFSRAAVQLGVSQPTISRRIETLEGKLGVRLFDRLPNGVILTVQGEGILEAARHIEHMILEIRRSVYGSDTRLRGTVRISVTDGLATYWMTPRLPAFQDEHPDIGIEFQCSVEGKDPLKMETDLCIQSRLPKAADLMVVKLGTLHFVPWASPGYLERHGAPRTPEELLHHRLLDHRIYYTDDGDWSDWFGLARAANLISYVTNSSAALLSAVQSGLGIGMMPTYACECVEGVVPLPLDLRTHSAIRLIYNRNVQSTARVRAVVAWIRNQFDQTESPWFSDEFVPPTVPPAKSADDQRGSRSSGHPGRELAGSAMPPAAK